MRISHGHEPPAADVADTHPVSVTIHLTRAEAAALGAELSTITDWYASALLALVALRTGRLDGDTAATGPGRTTAADWHALISDVDRRLMPRLTGIRDALIRAHAAAGGSIGDLAVAMDVPRSTAQARRQAVLTRDSAWEVWAITGGPGLPPPPTEVGARNAIGVTLAIYRGDQPIYEHQCPRCGIPDGMEPTYEAAAATARLHRC